MLLESGYGITNIVAHATASADELSRGQLEKGACRLEKKIQRFRPQWVAILGVTAYRMAFRVPKARLGQQAENPAGARVWILPNPSGLNAHFQLCQLADLFRAFRQAVAASHRSKLASICK